MPYAVSYLPHAQIDKVKWDACVQQASNGLVYARSVYLDAMAPGWNALVLNDYEAVFPLPWRRKWGIYYLYQPLLTAQLGLFGNGINEKLFNAFLRAIPQKFRYLDLPLNHRNRFANTVFPLYFRVNYVLPLQQSYETLFAGYRQNIRRNIKKALQLGCTTQTNIPVQPVLDLAAMHVPDKAGLQRFGRLYQQLHQQNAAITYGVYGPNGSLLASCIFFLSHGRAYYILVGNHPNGRTLGASHLLIDAFIRDHAQTERTLDFEGSDLRNLAFFYSSFGAVEEPYAALLCNRLPWWLRSLKK